MNYSIKHIAINVRRYGNYFTVPLVNDKMIFNENCPSEIKRIIIGCVFGLHRPDYTDLGEEYSMNYERSLL